MRLTVGHQEGEVPKHTYNILPYGIQVHKFWVFLIIINNLTNKVTPISDHHHMW